MAIRPPGRGFSVSRALSERARATQTPPDTTADLFGIGELVGSLRGMMEQFAAAAQQTQEGGSTGTFSVGSKESRVVFGYTMRMGPDGVSAEPFGNVVRPEKTAEPADLQPITDVYLDGETVVVIAELPGADPARVVCRSSGSRLLIEAQGARSYRKDLALPVPVRSDGISRRIENGILEVRLARAGAT